MSVLSSTGSGKKYYEWMENLHWFAEKELFYLYNDKSKNLCKNRRCIYFLPVVKDGIVTYEQKEFYYNSDWDVETFVNDFILVIDKNLNKSIFKLSDVKISLKLKNVLNKETYEHSKKHK